MNWVILLLLLILVVALVAPIVWAALRVSKWRFKDAQAAIVSPEGVDPVLLEKLGAQVAPLLSSGFEYQGMRSESRMGRTFLQAILSSAEGMVWAIAEEPEGEQSGREVSFVSFGGDGDVVVTRDGDVEFGPVEHKGSFQEGVYESALGQAEAHAAFLQEREVPVQAVDGEVFLKWLDRRARRSLDYLFESGWLQESPEEELKVAPSKLPSAGVAYLLQQWKQKQRSQAGGSWLVEQKPSGEESVIEESEEMDAPVSNEAVAENALVQEELTQADEDIVSELPNEEIEPEPQVEEVVEVFDEVAEELPLEEGLERDVSLYKKQAAEKSWGYWLRGFGWRAFFFLTVVVFVLWVAKDRGWSAQMLGFLGAALLIHELGHAIAMLIRRSWDWSQFLIPLPHPMKAKSWPIGGGLAEVFTTLAGPLPGFAFGWATLAYAFSGGVVSESMLDFALACALLNSFTLLPVLPLDGGRLLDLAILRSAPGLRIFGLLVGGALALTAAALGGTWLAIVIAGLLLAGIPSARRKSSLLPWIKANAKPEPLEAGEVGLAILHEKKKESLFKGIGGAAKVDELVGLGQGKPVGFFGSALCILVLLVAWVGPATLPLLEVGKRAQVMVAQQKEAADLADHYWPPLEPVEVGLDQGLALAALEQALQVSSPEKVFADPKQVERVRFVVNGNAMASWANKDSAQRFPVVSESVQALRLEAMKSADKGDAQAAFRDLSFAFRILISWEPRHELDAWVAWMEQEREVLKELEDISSRYPLPDTKVKWFEDALSRFRQPSGPKIAALLLRDGQDLEGLLRSGPKKLLSQVAPSIPVQSGAQGPGRSFLSLLRRPASFLPFDSTQQTVAQAKAVVEASSSARNWNELGKRINASDKLKESFSRIEANRSFREIALSALRIKRLGTDGAKPELAKLRSEFGFQYRVVKDGERESLMLSRLTDGGERIEMEWLLKQ